MEDNLLVNRELDNGNTVELYEYIFNYRLMLVSPQKWVLKQYWYHDLSIAVAIANNWDGKEEPTGWYKNFQTNETNPENAITMSSAEQHLRVLNMLNKFEAQDNDERKSTDSSS